MDLEKNLFAKEHLTPSVRLTTALKVTAKVHCNGNYNLTAIMFALLYNSDGVDKLLTGYQKNAAANISFSEEKCQMIRELFIDVYNNDEMLLEYLNGIITHRSITIYNKKRKLGKDDSIATVHNIINSDLLSDLDLSL